MEEEERTVEYLEGQIEMLMGAIEGWRGVTEKLIKALRHEVDNCYVCGSKGEWITEGYPGDCAGCINARRVLMEVENG